MEALPGVPGKDGLPPDPEGSLVSADPRLRPKGTGFVQRCVDPLHETVHQLDVQALCDAKQMLVLASKLWLLMDPTEECRVAQRPPLLASTHRHRPIRGGVKTANGWVSVASYTAAYPPAMCVDLAKFYKHCMKDLKRGSLRTSPLSEYDDVEGWPELRMRELVAAIPFTEDQDFDEGEEELRERHLVREKFVLEVQATDEGNQPQFEKSLPLGNGSLRFAMAESQWEDSAWIQVLHKLSKMGHDGAQLSDKGHSFRMGEDRTLEVGVQLPGHTAATWVVVVPDGKVPGTSTSWNQFCFVSLHAHAGAHFAPDKTLALLARACWWEHMRRDVLMWCDRRWQCLQYRRRPDQVPAGCHVSYMQRPWQDVMIDCEGPSSPADIATGAKYVPTLRCAMWGSEARVAGTT